MSSEKRRRARVQGGWASSTKSSSSHSRSPRSDANKAPMPTAAAWLGQNADGKPKETKKFVFQEPEEVNLLTQHGPASVYFLA